VTFVKQYILVVSLNVGYLYHQYISKAEGNHFIGLNNET